MTTEEHEQWALFITSLLEEMQRLRIKTLPKKDRKMYRIEDEVTPENIGAAIDAAFFNPCRNGESVFVLFFRAVGVDVSARNKKN
jgi:hypothetical protein